MVDAVLRYVDRLLDELAPGECTFRRARLADGTRQWRLWFVVLNEVEPDAGVRTLLSVAIAPGGPAVDAADPTTRAWALTRVATGRWAWDVAPSINARDVWHHTPQIIDVPEPPPWERAALQPT